MREYRLRDARFQEYVFDLVTVDETVAVKIRLFEERVVFDLLLFTNYPRFFGRNEILKLSRLAIARILYF